MRQVVYTAIIGGYDKLIEPECKADGVDFICFTDKKLKSSSWDVRIIEPFVKNDNCRSARYVKLHPHLFLGGYDYSMYVDGNKRVLQVPDVKEHLSGYSLGVEKHTHRNCVYDEILACKRLNKCSFDDLNRQMAFYIGIKYPTRSGLWGTDLLLREHNNQELIEKEETWWEHLLRFSQRDQVSFPYVFKDFPFKDINIIDRKRWLEAISGHSK